MPGPTSAHPAFFTDVDAIARPLGASRDEAARVELAWYLRQCDSALALSLLPPAAESTGRAALVHAEAAIQEWRHDDAAALIEKAERAAQDDELLALDALLMCAMLASSSGQAPRALDLAEQAHARARHKDREELAVAYAAFVSVYGAPATTQARLDVLAKMSPGPVAQVYAGVTQCMVDFNRGNHAQVAQRLEELVAEAGRLGMLTLQLRMQNTLAAAYSNLDDKDTAIAWVGRSIEQARAAGWAVATGEALAFLGNFYREIGQTSRARETLEEARQMLSVASASRGYALACCYLSHALLDAGEPWEASERALEAEAVARAVNALPIRIDVFTVAGRAIARSGKPERGVELVQRALELAREKDLPTWRIDALRALAEIHAQFKVPPPPGVTAAEAPLFYLREAQAAVDGVGGHAEKGAILRELSRAHERAGDFAAALAAAHEALAQTLSDEARRINNKLLAVEARHQIERQRLEAESQRRLAEEQKARAEALDLANAELRKAQGELEVLASTDPLTGISNRRSFLGTAEAEVARSLRYSRPLALVIGDIDHFKAINDTRGHPCGDRVIVAAARMLDARRRGTDRVGRFGGEEFAVLLPETDLETAIMVAERIRNAVETCAVDWEGKPVPFTMSFGVGVLLREADRAGDPAEALENLIQRADAALYEAKRAGRNRVSGVT